MKLRSVFVLTFAATLVIAAPAQADDAAVFTAYRSHAAELKQGADAYNAAMKPIRKHHGWRNDAEAQAVIDADTTIDNVLATITGEIKAAQPSTDAGAKAQKLSLREGALFAKANVYEQQGIAAELAGHHHKSDQLAKKSFQTYHRYQSTSHLARVAWKKLGFKPSRYGIGN